MNSESRKNFNKYLLGCLFQPANREKRLFCTNKKLLFSTVQNEKNPWKKWGKQDSFTMASHELLLFDTNIN